MESVSGLTPQGPAEEVPAQDEGEAGRASDPYQPLLRAVISGSSLIRAAMKFFPLQRSPFEEQSLSGELTR